MFQPIRLISWILSLTFSPDHNKVEQHQEKRFHKQAEVMRNIKPGRRSASDDSELPTLSFFLSLPLCAAGQKHS